MDYLNNYLNKIDEKGITGFSDAIKKTATDIAPNYIDNFSFTEHVVSLLIGEVQSGKTSHMFGIMCAAADSGFSNFLLLTPDNISLQEQTLKRAKAELVDFCIYDEIDTEKYKTDQLKKPAVIVLKKNAYVLKQWKTTLQESNLCCGNPLFIVDDEGDAASLNTLINRNSQSSINKNLNAIKKLSASSIYMQVTGTPQALLLQTVQSEWKPYYVYYFEPRPGYIGGNFFFPSDPPPQIIITNDEEADDILSDDEFPVNGLKYALITHLISSGHIILSGGKACNFLIHPSMMTIDHEIFAGKVGAYINELFHSSEESDTFDSFEMVYDNLLTTMPGILPLEDIYEFIKSTLTKDNINILTVNSISSSINIDSFKKGINIIVGGNILGRGLTIPKLQTIYYCRTSQNPQADTMWQHSRMFGYDREIGLMRVFMPANLFKLFSDINNTNNSLVKQIKNDKNNGNIRVVYPTYLRPTRKSVIDRKSIRVYSGGVNYFPFSPINKNIDSLDLILKPFEKDTYSVTLKLFIQILEYLDSESDDWNSKDFIGFINTFIQEHPSKQGILIVRRNRDISKGTGTLLSPDDRLLGDRYPNDVVLTLYKITGSIDKKWEGEEIWIPNIKLPEGYSYYGGENR